jgi:hypothetical protein
VCGLVVCWPAALNASVRQLARGDGGGTRSFRVVHHDEALLNRGQLQQSLDGLAPWYDGEVVPILVRIVV